MLVFQRLTPTTEIGMCPTNEAVTVIISDLHETTPIIQPSNNASPVSSTTNNSPLPVDISACLPSLNIDEPNDDSQCSYNAMSIEFKLACTVETCTSSSCHSDTSIEMESNVPINLTTPKAKIADEPDDYH